MKRCILLSLFSLLFAVLLPAAAWYLSPDGAGPAAPEASEAVPEAAPEAALPETAARPAADAGVTVRLLHAGAVETMTMEEYLPGAIAGEMPASFEAAALRAQAVASRTWALRRMARSDARHPEADVCDDPGCCQAWLGEDELRARWGTDCGLYAGMIRQAVLDTDGLFLAYGGEPILACFHSSSAGQTESCAALWGTALPYLVSVDTPETAGDVPGYVSTLSLSPEEFRERMLAAYPAAALEGSPAEWLGERVLDVSGRVAAVRVGAQQVPGTQMRALFGLRSACFTLEWTGGAFLFTVTGSGHGAGMSQYGANVMAREGASWQEILAHYYPGAELTAPGSQSSSAGRTAISPPRQSTRAA